MTKGPLFLQDEDEVETLSKRRNSWPRKKNSSKLNELQEVLVNDEDFLKRVIESFCQEFKDVEITQFLQADKHQRQDEKLWLPKKLKENPE